MRVNGGKVHKKLMEKQLFPSRVVMIPFVPITLTAEKNRINSLFSKGKLLVAFSKQNIYFPVKL